MSNILSVELASGDALDVRDFSVSEGMSTLFEVRLTAMSTSPDVDFEAAIGGAARFEIARLSPVDGETRYWNGICARVGQIRVEPSGLSTYAIRIVPALWLLSQRRNYRVFQDQSELDIAIAVLASWGIQPTLHLDPGSYTKRRIRVQYAESDLDFVSRLLEDVGVAYYFEQDGGGTSLILADAPNKGPVRVPLSFVDTPNERLADEHVTAVLTHREMRPGRYTQSDVDYRKALNYPLVSSASGGGATESQLERYHHNYGSFLWKAEGGGDTPHADDRGPARTSERDGAKQVQKRLDAQRVNARMASFRTNAHDLRPGKVVTIAGHPRTEIASPMLVVASTFSGNAIDAWSHACQLRYTDVDYRPELRTPKPRTLGVESATITGPSGEQIHTDEFGRVRVKFHWDREGADDETSSCWVPVNQPWAGAGFGSINLPRVGQEVLIDFLGSDPDRPIVMGRVFTLTTPPPYQLPKYKMVSGMRSETYPRPAAAPPDARLGGGPAGGGVPLVGLGAGTDNAGLASTASAAESAEAAGANPGLNGAPPMQLADLNAAVKAMGSQGSDGKDHHLAGNVFTVDDRAHEERMYLQAQKDLYETVKQNQMSTVGANRGVTVGGNDTTLVEKIQSTEVGLDRKVAVGRKQNHYVGDDMFVQCQKNMTTITPAGSQVQLAMSGIMLQTGMDSPSTILVLPDAIVIDAKEVYINPGATMMSALFAGKSAKDAAQAQLDRNKAAAAEIAANQKKIKSLMDDQMTAYERYHQAKAESDGYAQLARENPGNANYQEGAAYTQQQTDAAKANVDSYDTQMDALRSRNAALGSGS